mgnify:CR=1 FL=1
MILDSNHTIYDQKSFKLNVLIQKSRFNFLEDHETLDVNMNDINNEPIFNDYQGGSVLGAVAATGKHPTSEGLKKALRKECELGFSNTNYFSDFNNFSLVCTHKYLLLFI